MSAPSWSQADGGLERAYQRLLFSYPRRFRAEHGSDIVTTLLEMAEPGQRRPARTDALHLLASGLRHRFRLPARRPLAVIAAVVITLIAGAFGAAAGSWAGTLTFADLPGEESVIQPAGGTAEISFPHDASPWTADMVVVDDPGVRNWQAQTARDRYAATGWSVEPLTPVGGSASALDADGRPIELEVRGARFHAEKDGVRAQVSGWTTGSATHVSVTAWAKTTPMFLPLVVAGTALGLLTGWLLAASLTYRIVRSRRRRTATVTAAVALAALVLPAVALYGNAMRAFRYYGDDVAFTVHSAFNPGDYYPFGPPWQVLGYTTAGIVLAGIAVALSRTHADPQPSPAVN